MILKCKVIALWSLNSEHRLEAGRPVRRLCGKATYGGAWDGEQMELRYIWR